MFMGQPKSPSKPCILQLNKYTTLTEPFTKDKMSTTFQNENEAKAILTILA